MSMAFLKTVIARYDRRFQKLQERPDPNRLLESTKLLYENELELRKAQLLAVEEGRPFAEAPGLMRVVKAMGLHYVDTFRLADCVEAGEGEEYFDKAVSLLLPDDLCDRLITPFPMFVANDIPEPKVIVASEGGCPNEAICLTGVASFKNIPHFFIDLPFEATDNSLRYVTKQLEEMTDFIEREVPGARFDSDKLAELQNWDRRALAVCREIYSLLATSPCPIAPRDAFRIMREPSRFPNPEKYLAYVSTYRDELLQRVTQGFAGVGHERLRLMWAVSGPYVRPPFDLLAEQGVAVPIFMTGLTPGAFGLNRDPDEVFGRRLSPLEREAATNLLVSWFGPTDRWIADVLRICKDLGLDGIVHYLQQGCTLILGSGQLLADKAREQSLHCLNIPGRQVAVTDGDREFIAQRLSEFVEFCVEAKGSSACR